MCIRDRFWEETHPGVDVNGGLFNVILGEITTFESIGVEFLDQYWVGVSVGGGAELTPRYKLTASPYSMADGHWYQDGTNLYSVPTGNVGIGVTSPVDKFHVVGKSRFISSSAYPTVHAFNTFQTGQLGAEIVAGTHWAGVYGRAYGVGTAEGALGHSSGYGVWGSQGIGSYAGYFDGDVNITGDLTVDGSYPGGGGGGLWTDVTTYIRPNDNANIFIRDAGQTRDIQVDITSSSKWYGLFVDNSAAAYNGSSYREGFTKSAIGANVDNAGKRQCAIVGWSALTSDSSASVLGANTDGTTWGALGYNHNGDEYSAFFNNIAYLGSKVSIGQPTPTTSAQVSMYHPISPTMDFINDDETWRITNPALNNLHFHNVGGPSNVLVLEHGTGYVGINTVDPAITFHIKQRTTAADGVRFEKYSDSNYWDLGIASTNNFWFRYNGSLEAWINNTDGTYNAVSDRRLKTEIEPMEPVLDRIAKLQPVNYYFKNDTEREHKSMGFIAQDVAEVFPSVAPYEEEFGFYGINYSYLTVLTLQGLIELNTEYQNAIENQNTRLETLESQIELLKAEIESLKK